MLLDARGELRHRGVVEAGAPLPELPAAARLERR
jgi:hypothetical protein